ncbi:Clp protease ClpP [Rhizobacter sp. P5_C2]
MSATPWYSIHRRPLASTQSASPAPRAEIWIYGDIGESWYGDGVAAKDFVQTVAALDADTITVRLNSYGGSVSDGIAIYDALKRHPATVAVSVDGIAASIASLIAMAGDRIEIAENAMPTERTTGSPPARLSTRSSPTPPPPRCPSARAPAASHGPVPAVPLRLLHPLFAPLPFIPTRLLRLRRLPC